jgi:hypothetical protein
VSGTGDVLGSAEWDSVTGSMLDAIKINDRTRGARLPISWRNSAAERPLPKLCQLNSIWRHAASGAGTGCGRHGAH